MAAPARAKEVGTLGRGAPCGFIKSVLLLLQECLDGRERWRAEGRTKRDAGRLLLHCTSGSESERERKS